MVFKSRNRCSAAPTLTVRRYHVIGMDSRCEQLFHSMMRLVDDKAQSRWVHDPDAHDLVITGPDATDLPCPDAVPRRLSGFISGQRDDCAMLRLAGMIEALNVVDEMLAARSPAGVGEGSPKEPGDAAVRLLRWPGRSLMALHPGCPKMATLLLSRPLTIAELSRLSGVEPRICDRFVARLSQFGLVQRREPVDGAGAAERSRGAGLFAAIRARLGLGEVVG